MRLPVEATQPCAGFRSRLISVLKSACRADSFDVSASECGMAMGDYTEKTGVSGSIPSLVIIVLNNLASSHF